MTFHYTQLFCITAAVLLGGCAGRTTFQIDERHPASTAASESTVAAMPVLLRPDEMSRRTRQLIAQRAAAAEMPAQDPSPGESVPAAPANQGTPATSNKPAGHDHH